MAEKLKAYGGKKLIDLGFLLIFGVFVILAAQAVVGGDYIVLLNTTLVP